MRYKCICLGMQNISQFTNHGEVKMENDFLSQLESDATAIDSTPKDEELSKVADIAKKIQEKEDFLADLEKKQKTAKAELLKLTDEDLPAILQELGLSGFTLDDGSSITIKPTYGAHIKVSNREEAFEWLRKHDFGDLIKNIVSCTFGRGEDNTAVDFMTFAEKSGFNPQQKTDVHSQTLKAWVRERVENGDSFPMELFGAYIGQRATIKRK
mgnify:CR=1 FL=1